jgi:thymidylate kinase
LPSPFFADILKSMKTKYVSIRKVAHSLGWKLKSVNTPDTAEKGRPWYVMIEGVDGVGKSTFAEALREECGECGITAKLVHEPFYPTALPEKPEAENFQLDRERYYSSHQPDDKTWVISDRSLFSTLAYNPCTPSDLKRMAEWLENPAYFGSYNKALVLLSANEETLQERLKKRQNEGIPLDALEIDRQYQSKVAQKYLDMAYNQPLPLDACYILAPSRLRRLKWLKRN